MLPHPVVPSSGAVLAYFVLRERRNHLCPVVHPKGVCVHVHVHVRVCAAGKRFDMWIHSGRQFMFRAENPTVVPLKYTV